MHSQATLTPRQLPLLITGIAGVAGYNALHYFQKRYPGQVIGIRREQTADLVGDGIFGIDTEDYRRLGELFDTYRFRSVLNTEGNCALKVCEVNPELARQSNVVTAECVVAQVKHHTARLVHISSDLVFAGRESGHYCETDPVDPVTIYGKTMVTGEQIVRAEAAGAAILRMSLPMGPSFNRHAGAIDWIQSRFRKNLPATLYFDEVRSATYTADLNRVFEWFLVHEQPGLYHMGGPRPDTLYEIGQIVNRVGGYAPQLLQGCPRSQAGPVPPRAGNVSMCSDKLVSLLGRTPFRPWPVGADVQPSHVQWHSERDEETQGSLDRLANRLYRYPTELV